MRVLVFAPHNDDEILDVGGMTAEYIMSNVCEVTRAVLTLIW